MTLCEGALLKAAHRDKYAFVNFLVVLSKANAFSAAAALAAAFLHPLPFFLALPLFPLRARIFGIVERPSRVSKKHSC